MSNHTVFNKLLTSNGAWKGGVVVIRIITGMIIFNFGLELFSNEKMAGYTEWLTDLKFPSPLLLAKTGKVIELAGGALLAIGLFTRLATMALVITMFFIAFIMGEGQILSGDSAFLLLLIFLHFFLTGPGKWSLDYLFFAKKKMLTTHQ